MELRGDDRLEALMARLALAEAGLFKFFGQSRDLMCVAGFDGYVQRLNPAWTTQLGWVFSDLKDKPLVSFVHPEDSEMTLAAIKNLNRTATPTRFESRFRHNDGTYRRLRWNAQADPGGKQIYATAQDISLHEGKAQEILAAIDDERERLGRELHDGLCQGLAGIVALSLTLSRGLAAQADFAGSEMAADIANLLKQTMGEARDLARGLGPIRLPAVGLEAALEGLALNVRHLHEVTCTFDRDAVFPRLKEDVEAHIFRIAQQAVDNAVTHGATNTIEIRLSHEDGRGVLSIRDDGVGLPPKGLGSGGTGLHGMAYRAQLIGGVLDVCGLQPRGTAVKCLFPLIRGPETHETS